MQRLWNQFHYLAVLSSMYLGLEEGLYKDVVLLVDIVDWVSWWSGHAYRSLSISKSRVIESDFPLSWRHNGLAWLLREVKWSTLRLSSRSLSESACNWVMVLETVYPKLVHSFPSSKASASCLPKLTDSIWGCPLSCTRCQAFMQK